MAPRRLVLTTGAMTGIAAVLGLLAPTPGGVVDALSGPQRLVDTAGPGALVLAVVGGLAWLVWSWGALGLALTAVSVIPGVAGTLARTLVRAVLPEAARRAAAVALGAGLALTGPLAGTAPAAPPASPTAPVPDWPAATPSPEPAATAGPHVVVRGECLWRIAAADLRGTTGETPTGAGVAAAVSAWWTANRSVIGADPDLIVPGQLLEPPTVPTPP